MMTQEAMLDTPRRPAEGGAWLDESELAAELRQSPRFYPLGPWLIPTAVVLLWAVWIASYFGVPAALLDGVVLLLIAGHFWPSWLATDSARYWAPRERYMRLRIGPDGLETSSVDRHENRPWHLVRSVHFAQAGWIVRFGDAPPLWLPRTAFTSGDVDVVERCLASLPREQRRRVALPLTIAAFACAVLGTIAWYVIVR